MLTLTDEQIQVIKNGYKRVQVTVSFPFDNVPDITNEQIVYESLSFNESVCSSDVFRFGNAEASTVSFETVGVGNILGKVIDVKLTYEYILPEDPTNVRTFDLPYGRFTVTSCPRNHENMAHRQVQATSRTSDTNDELMSQIEKDKLNNMYSSDKDYEPNVQYLLDSMHNSLSSEYSSVEVANRDTGTSTTGTYRFNLGRLPGSSDSYSLSVSLTHKTVSIVDSLYKVTHTYDSEYDSLVDELCDTYTAANKGVRRDLKALGYVRVTDSYWRGAYKDMNSMGYVYPYINITESKFDYPYSISMILYRGTTPIETYGTFVPYPAISFVKYDATGTRFPMYLAINHTLETTLVSGKEAYSFANAYTLADIETGFAELNAGFNRRNRDGSSSVTRLDNSDPYELTGADVEGQAWWDEYSVADIGSVKYCWTDGKGDHEGEYVMDTNGSVYDMTDNGLLKNIKLKVKTVNSVSKMTDQTMYYVYNDYWYAYNGTAFVQMSPYTSKSSIIEYMLDTFFLPYADIHFTPIDMDLRGMPYLQAGDAIRFTAKDGTVVDSYILNHIFTGIQHITENIETVQGEVLE